MKSLKRRRKGEKVNTVRTGENAPIVVLDLSCCLITMITRNGASSWLLKTFLNYLYYVTITLLII